MNDINNKLNELENEEIIWIIYLGIIALSFYSNNLERKYFLYNDLVSKNKYQSILIIIFTILVIIYFYFLKNAYNEIKNIDINKDNKKNNLLYLSFLASLFIFISGTIYLYIAIKDENIDVELAFN